MIGFGDRATHEGRRDGARRWGVPAAMAAMAVGATFGLGACSKSPEAPVARASAVPFKIEPGGTAGITLAGLMNNEPDQWTKLKDQEPKGDEVVQFRASVAYGGKLSPDQAARDASQLNALATQRLGLVTDAGGSSTYQSGPHTPAGEVTVYFIERSEVGTPVQ